MATEDIGITVPAERLCALDLDADIVYARGEREIRLKKVSLITQTRKYTLVRSVNNRDAQIKHNTPVTVFHRRYT